MKEKLLKVLQQKLSRGMLELNNEAFIEDYYKKKSENYKNKYSLEKFKKKVSIKIYDIIESKNIDIINNAANLCFNNFIIDLLKNGLNNQFASQEKKVLNEIYEQLFKD